MIKVHLYGTFYGTGPRSGTWSRRGRARIVNIASISASSLRPAPADYSAAKAAIVALTRAVGRRGGPARHPRQRRRVPATSTRPCWLPMAEHAGLMLMRIGSGRMGEAEEMAEARALPRRRRVELLHRRDLKRVGRLRLMPTMFSRIIDGEIPGTFVWRDDLCVAFMSINPLDAGHALVVPIEPRSTTGSTSTRPVAST